MDQIPSSTDPLQQPKKNDQEESNQKLVSCDDFLFIGVSILFIVIGLPFDIKLTVDYFAEGNMWFGGQTVLFIVIPIVILNTFSVWWYKTDAGIDNPKDANRLRIVRKVFTFLLMVRLLRKLEEGYYAVKTCKATEKRVKEQYSKKMKFYAINASILSVFDTFMASGPQVVLQLYIFTKLHASTHDDASTHDIITETDWWLLFRIFKGFCCMSFSYTCYQRSMRFGLEERKNLNKRTALFVFVWRFFDVASRILCLSLFASVFPYCILLVCCTHFIGMFIWIRKMETNFFENNKKRELVYNLVLAEVFIFFYFNPKKQSTQSHYTVYYVVMFLENTTLMCLWYCYYPPDGFGLIGLILQFSSFLFAMVFMVIYYYFVHPSIGKCRQKCPTAENPSGTQMENYETNANSDQNKNMNTEVSYS